MTLSDFRNRNFLHTCHRSGGQGTWQACCNVPWSQRRRLRRKGRSASNAITPTWRLTDEMGAGCNQMVPRSALWETLENSFHQRMLCERRRCLLPTAIRQVEPFLSEVQQVGFVVGT